eukprot:CAMPEP_0184547370 /NCGR_PEP_ID=MMETSP0199_2-20130426/5535_1 /TAXON_ID=1112570 /ORGANISM="Thraustochytrium sp., Strain LLF1b" /LENGTH=943 /DNA_ID=CAMNT_0026941861 /DNA_START=159 /DNA_END=2987 /DNA_ORIENTATION=-
MKRSRPVVQWSPHSDRDFVVCFGLELKHYEVQAAQSQRRGLNSLSDSVPTPRHQVPATFPVTTRTSPRPLICADWFPGASDPLLVAAGDTQGNVRLVSFQESRQANDGLVKIYSSRNSRDCNSVRWNRNSPNRIVAGLEMIRSDNGLVVWDVNYSNYGASPLSGDQKGAFARSRNRAFAPSQNATSLDTPIYEAGASEGSAAVAWVPNEANVMAVGTSFKWLRLYDMRAPNTGNRQASSAVSAHMKVVRGVCFDPNNSFQLATFSEDSYIKTWDRRNLKAPLVRIISPSKSIVLIGWSPARAGLLASICADEKAVRLWNVNKASALASNELDFAPAHLKPGNGGMNSSPVEPRIGDEYTQIHPTVDLHKVDITRYTARPPASFCWIPPGVLEVQQEVSEDQVSDDGKTVKIIPSLKRLTASASRAWMVSWTGLQFDHVSLQEPLPISLSPSSNIAFGLNSAVLRSSFRAKDPATVIQARARIGYALEPKFNIDLFSKAIRIAAHGVSTGQSSGPKHFGVKSLEEVRAILLTIDGMSIEDERARMIRLRDLWRWVDRATQMINPMQSKGLVEAGLITIVAHPDGETRPDTEFRPRFEIFRNRQRSFALSLCGWSNFGENTAGTGSSTQNLGVETQVDYSKFSSVSNVPYSSYLASGEDSDYQRLAALAVFCCDLSSAVRILQDASERLRAHSNEQQATKSYTDSQEYKIEQEIASFAAKYWHEEDFVADVRDSEAVADLLQLVAMAFAGYPEASATTEGSALWLETCRKLITRLHSFPILRAAFTFLVENFRRRTKNKPHTELDADTAPGSAALKTESLSDENIAQQRNPVDSSQDIDPMEATETQRFTCVTEEPALALADRVAFACRFLPDTQLFEFLANCCEKVTSEGHLDGIILTGLGTHGMRLIQTYVDKTGDVQTAALVACHTELNELQHQDSSRASRW